MDPQAFEQDLLARGYATVVTREFPPHAVNALHSHPFDARALVLAGEIAIDVDGRRTVYRAGDVFVFDRDVAHAEHMGPEGVRYLVGRR